MTQSDINNAVNTLVNSYTGKTEGYHGGYTGQCTVPVSYYVESLTGTIAPYMANDRADGWGTNFPEALSPYFTPVHFAIGTGYPKGTILIWNSPHIAILTEASNGGSTVEVFEQNADPDGSACHTATRTLNTPTHTCTYALIPIVTEPPVVPPTPTCTYSRITPITLQTNKDPTEWWALNWTDINKAVAVNQISVNTPFPAVGQAHHVSGNQYYMTAEDFGNADVTGTPTNNNGINIADLSPVPPPLPPPAPALSTAAPAAVAPDTTPYTLVTTVNSYTTAANALQRIGVSTPLEAGSYYKFNTLNGMDSLTKTLGQNMQWWINPTDNVLPLAKPVVAPWIDPPLPTPAPVVPTSPVTTPVENTSTPVRSSPPNWKSTYKAFNRENLPVKYTLLDDVDVHDYSGVRPDALLDKGDDVWVFGFFTNPEGIVCGRLRSDKDKTFQYYFGVPATDMRAKGKVLTTIDYIDLGFQRVMDFVKRKV